MQFIRLRTLSPLLAQSRDITSFRNSKVFSKNETTTSNPFLCFSYHSVPDLKIASPIIYRTFATESLPFQRSNLLESLDVAIQASKPITLAQSFSDLVSLPKNVEANMKSLGFTSPLEIQSRSIPAILGGDDTIIHSYTGTGKTLSFILPIVARVLSEKLRDSETKFVNNSLILVPTRELGMQIESLIKDLLKNVRDSKKTKLNEYVVQSFYSGDEDVETQLKTYEEKKPSILIATPKRFVEILNLTIREKEEKKNDEIQIRPKERNFKNIENNKKTDKKPINKIPTELSTKAFLFIKSIKTVVVDEADQQLRPLTRYATVYDKAKRERHPRPTNVALQGIVKHSRGAQLICSSATINRPLLNVLYSLGFRHPTTIDTVKKYTIPEHIRHYYRLANETSMKFTRMCSLYTERCENKPALVVIDGHESVDTFVTNLQNYGF